MSPTSDARPEPCSRKRTRAPAATLLAAILAAAPGCGEWSEYWDEDRGPTGPGPSRDTNAPSVSLATPSGTDSAHATPVGGAAYRVVVDAVDDIAVERVEVFLDDQPLGETAAPPWEIAWDTRPLDEASLHRLRAIAADAAGNVGQSGEAFAQVFNLGPQVVLVSPADGALVRGTVRVAVEFPGEAPEIAQVEFLADIFTAGIVASPPWILDLDTTTLFAGQHFVAAKATTVLGHVGVSAPVRVHVNNETPQTTLHFPPAGHRVASRGTLVLVASAADPVEGALRPDQIAWRSTREGLLGTGNELRKANLAAGSHTIHAIGTNSWGTADSASVDVEVLARPTYEFCPDVFFPLIEQFFCTFCHYPGSSQYPDSELDLRTWDSLMAGGKSQGSYECVSPCRPELSLIYNKVTQSSPWVGGPMPPPDSFPPVSAAAKEALRVWILEGAPPGDAPDCWDHR
jgi:hypothetical protein